MERLDAGKRLWKEMAALLPPKQRRRFWLVLLILGVSAVLSQITPLAVGWLTDHILAGPEQGFGSVIPALSLIHI